MQRLQPFAAGLGVVLHPAVPGFFVALHATLTFEGGLTARLCQTALLVSALCVGLPLGALLLSAKTHRDVWAGRRETRIYFYPAAAIGLASSFLVFDLLYPFPFARTMVVAAGGVLALLAFANRYLKVSVHCAGNAGIAVAATWTYGAIAAPLFLIIPIIACARVLAKKHTITETLAGTAIGASITAAALWTMH